MSTIKSSNENLTLNADGSSKDIKFQANGVEKASISSAGVLSSAGGTTHADNVKAKFGTGNDLEIYHDGSNSYIDDVGTGNLLIKGQNLKLLGSNDDNILFGQQGGAVTLYHSNAAKFATNSTGAAVTGNLYASGGYLGLNTGDRIHFTDNTSAIIEVNGGERLTVLANGNIVATGILTGGGNIAEVASGNTDAISANETFNIHTATVNSAYLVTANAGDSLTNAIAFVAVGTAASTMRFTLMGGSYNTTITASGANIQITCGYGTNLVYAYRVIRIRG